MRRSLRRAGIQVLSLVFFLFTALSCVAEDSERLVPSPGEPPRSARRSFSTDFSRSLIRYDEILSGGVGKDGIPPIDNPQFVSVQVADAWLNDTEAVFVVEADGESKIYPVQILMYHEIVNDMVGETPVAVTYCPLCNTGLTFLRRVDGRELTFGVSGFLRFSNLIMWDRQTETWWQQATGRAIVGELTGLSLDLHPMLMISWKEARGTYLEAEVLSRDTGYSRPYGRNPYSRYDSASEPFLYRGPQTPSEYDAMDRVLVVEVDDESSAFPYPVLQEQGVVAETVAGRSVVVFWQEGTASALDASSVAGGRDVGAANAFFAELDGEILEFEADSEGRIRDRATESTWSVSGRAVSGPLAGDRLEPVTAIQHFWFSWTAFDPSR